MVLAVPAAAPARCAWPWRLGALEVLAIAQCGLADSRRRRAAGGPLSARRRADVILPDQHRPYLRVGAGLLGGLPAAHTRGHGFPRRAGSTPAVPLPVHHDGGLSVVQSRHAVDLRGGHHAGLGASGRFLQHQGRGGSGLEISDRLHRRNRFRPVRHHRAVPGGGPRRGEPGIGARLGRADVPRLPACAARRTC